MQDQAPSGPKDKGQDKKPSQGVFSVMPVRMPGASLVIYHGQFITCGECLQPYGSMLFRIGGLTCVS